MKNLLTFFTFTILAIWGIGFAFFNFHWGYHCLLILAAITFVLRLLITERTKEKELRNILSSGFYNANGQFQG